MYSIQPKKPSMDEAMKELKTNLFVLAAFLGAVRAAPFVVSLFSSSGSPSSSDSPPSLL